MSSARAPASVPMNNISAGCIDTPASPGSVMCTLKASPNTRGISHSSPPPKSGPAEMFTSEATVRFNGIVPEPKNS